jgi:chromosome segregation ATPase
LERDLRMLKRSASAETRAADVVIATDARGSDYVLPLDFPDVAEELSAHVRRLLDAGDELIIIRADRTQTVREELAEVEARVAMLQAQIGTVCEERDRLREELQRKEAQLADVQLALDAVNAALGRVEHVPSESRDSSQ